MIRGHDMDMVLRMECDGLTNLAIAFLAGVLLGIFCTLLVRRPPG